MSFKEHLGYEDSLLPRIATGFGGGIGRKGSICGALTGSVMVIGMKYGRTDPADQKAAAKVYGKCRQAWDRFEEEFGKTNCFDLTGYHLDDPEGMKQFLATGGREKCGDLVKKVARILCELIEKEPG